MRFLSFAMALCLGSILGCGGEILNNELDTDENAISTDDAFSQVTKVNVAPGCDIDLVNPVYEKGLIRHFICGGAIAVYTSCPNFSGLNLSIQQLINGEVAYSTKMKDTKVSVPYPVSSALEYSYHYNKACSSGKLDANWFEGEWKIVTEISYKDDLGATQVVTRETPLLSASDKTELGAIMMTGGAYPYDRVAMKKLHSIPQNEDHLTFQEPGEGTVTPQDFTQSSYPYCKVSLVGPYVRIGKISEKETEPHHLVCGGGYVRDCDRQDMSMSVTPTGFTYDNETNGRYIWACVSAIHDLDKPWTIALKIGGIRYSLSGALSEMYNFGESDFDFEKAISE